MGGVYDEGIYECGKTNLLFNFTRLNKVDLKTDCEIGIIMNVVLKLVLFSLSFNKPAKYRILKTGKSEDHKKTYLW